VAGLVEVERVAAGAAGDGDAAGDPVHVPGGVDAARRRGRVAAELDDVDAGAFVHADRAARGHDGDPVRAGALVDRQRAAEVRRVDGDRVVAVPAVQDDRAAQTREVDRVTAVVDRDRG